MSGDRYAQPVHVIEVDVIDRAGLAIGHDDRRTDQLLLGCMQFSEDLDGSLVAVIRTAHGRDYKWP